jgi:hypothetical protein
MAFVALALSIGIVVGQQHKLTPVNSQEYLALIDAGSTGSRLHVFLITYNYDNHSTGVPYIVQCMPTHYKINVPLVAIENMTSNEIAAIFEPMLSAAYAAVPEHVHDRTSFRVFGTGGMRSLPIHRQELIYQSMLSSVKHSRLSNHFAVRRSFFRTISGHLEGLYGWIAVNYLNFPSDIVRTLVGDDHLKETMIGALEVGGASAQIAFLPSDHRNNNINTSIDNFHSSSAALLNAVYVKSFLGYGAQQMEKQLVENLVSRRSSFNPCSFDGSSTLHSSGHVLIGKGNFTQCAALITEQLAKMSSDGSARGLSSIPPFASNVRFWGMSLLYHVTHFLTIVRPSLPFPNTSILEIAEAGQLLCGYTVERVLRELDGKDPNTPHNRLRGRCFDSALVVTLLGAPVGFGFASNERRVTFIQHHMSSGSEVEWCLGAAVSIASETVLLTRRERHSIFYRTHISSMLILTSLAIAFSVLFITCCVHRRM